MANFTKPITVNGFVNLLTAMKAAGYQGSGIVSILKIYNPDATNLLYIHATDNGITAPGTGTDGWPIGTATGNAGTTFFTDRGANQSSLDLATCWLFTAASIAGIKIMAMGA
jgi:hypothetical protein